MYSKKYNKDYVDNFNKTKKKRNVKDMCCKYSKSNRTAKQILNDFVENTTLLGVQQTLRNKSVFWLLAFIFCAALSVTQSWSAAHEYFQKKSHQTFGIENKMLMPFPSVTICNNILLPFKTFNSTSVTGFKTFDPAEDRQNNVSETIIEEKQDKNREAVLTYIRELYKEEKNRYAVPVQEWLLKCIYQYNICNRSDTNLFYEFNHPVDGTCITFNPAFNQKGISVDIDTKLMVTMKRSGNFFQIHNGRPRVNVLIHPPGTTPIMDLPEAIDIFGGQNVNLGLRLTQKDFMLKHLDPPSCVQKKSAGDKYRKKNFYYTSKTPYQYSIEACMKTCVQNMINKPCSTLDATFPILEESYENNLYLKSPPIAVCSSRANVDISMEICGCPFPCKLYQYHVSLDTTDLQDVPSKNSNQSYDTNDLMKFSVQFQSNIFDHIKEELDYNLTGFMGILGGNLSLWLGLCVLSLLEIVELIWHLFCLWLRNIYKKWSFANFNRNDNVNKFHNENLFFNSKFKTNKNTEISFLNKRYTKY